MIPRFAATRWSALALSTVTVVVLFLAAACGGGSDSDNPGSRGDNPGPAATATVAPTVTPTSVPQEPNGERIRGYMVHLASDIGSRPAGSEKELEAARYLAGLLQGFGYDVSLQEFSLAGAAPRDSSLSVRSSSPRTISSVPFSGSGTGTARGRLVAAGRGNPNEFTAEATGAVVLIERGDLLFNDKVANAQASGVRGVIIFNNEEGTFAGGLSQTSTLPVVSISQAEGRQLLADLQRGAVEVEVSVGTLGASVSRNVIAKPPGKECETISGGHYDSVPQAPGANDNASGAATVVEIAGVLANNGRMGANCFVLFGGEELGLFGSKAFVASLDAAARARIKGMVNFDMVGEGGDRWQFLGTPELQQIAGGIATTLGYPFVLSQLPSSTSSDHASFIGAGIKAVMLYRPGLLHTPQDTADRIGPELLEQAARIGIAVLGSLNGQQ